MIVLRIRSRWRARLWLVMSYRSRRRARREFMASLDPATFHELVEDLRRRLDET